MASLKARRWTSRTCVLFSLAKYVDVYCECGHQVSDRRFDLPDNLAVPEIRFRVKMYEVRRPINRTKSKLKWRPYPDNARNISARQTCREGSMPWKECSVEEERLRATPTS